MKPRRVSRTLALVAPRPPVRERATTLAGQDAVEVWNGPVRLHAERAVGMTVARIEQRVAADLFERIVVIGADHFAGAHVDRPAQARRLLAHLDALAEAGLSLERLRTLLDDAELDRPGAGWALAWLHGSLDLPGVDGELETWVRSIDPASVEDYALVVELARAIEIVPNASLGERCRSWLTDTSAILRAVAIEASRAEALPPEVMARVARADEPLPFVALERALARGGPDVARLAPPRPSFREVTAPALAAEIACARAASGDQEPLALLRLTEPRAMAALGSHAMSVLALTAGAEDDELAGALSLTLQTSPEALAAMGLVGLPSVVTRIVRELTSEDFSDDAELALRTALGPPAQGVALAGGAAWEAAIATLQTPGRRVRLRGGEPHNASSVLSEMRRRDLSEPEVWLRVRELERLTGKRANHSWGAFGIPLDGEIARAATLTR